MVVNNPFKRPAISWGKRGVRGLVGPLKFPLVLFQTLQALPTKWENKSQRKNDGVLPWAKGWLVRPLNSLKFKWLPPWALHTANEFYRTRILMIIWKWCKSMDTPEIIVESWNNIILPKTTIAICARAHCWTCPRCHRCFGRVLRDAHFAAEVAGSQETSKPRFRGKCFAGGDFFREKGVKSVKVVFANMSGRFKPWVRLIHTWTQFNVTLKFKGFQKMKTNWLH